MDGLLPVIAVIALAATFVVWLVLQGGQRLIARQEATIQQTARGELEDMFIFVDTRRLFIFNIVALFVVPALLWVMFENPLFVVVSAIGIIVLPKWAVGFLRKRRFSRFEQQLPDALLMLSGALRAGASLTVAMEGMVKEQKPPLAQEFELMLREQRLGVDFDTALKNMEKRLPLQDFVMVIAGMRISREVGGNLADILESLADTLRRKHQMEGKIKSLTAQGKMQGIIMTALPLFLMLILTKMEPEAMAPLYNTWLGYGVLTVVLLMEMVGYFFIRKIVNIDV
ncbi:MAG: type II secretion system F family protein [Burkholderiales bacterium]|nr:type II secretion system F family protein [Burkholderiales bacterium]